MGSTDMAEKRRILPQWTDFTALQPGWHFEGDHRPTDAMRGWLEGAQWPDHLPVRLQVERGSRQSLTVQVDIEAEAVLICQRCWQPMPWQASLRQTLALVRAEQPGSEDPEWVLEDGRVYWQRLVEEEISLALPDYPRHATCDLHEPTAEA